MSHTPGPWSVFGERPTPRNCGIDADTVPFSIVVWGNAGDEDQGVQGRTRDEMLANARLIAAAPDLHEVARLLIKYCSKRDGTLANYGDWLQCFVEDGSTITEVVEKAVAALAKAEGQ